MSSHDQQSQKPTTHENPNSEPARSDHADGRTLGEFKGSLQHRSV